MKKRRGEYKFWKKLGFNSYKEYKEHEEWYSEILDDMHGGYI